MNIPQCSDHVFSFASMGPYFLSVTRQANIVLPIPCDDKDEKKVSPLAALLILSALDIGHRVSFQQKLSSILSHAVSSTDQYGLLDQSLNDLFQRQAATPSCVASVPAPSQGVANSTGVAAYVQVAAMATAAIGSAISVSA
ncbi:hypothetical protein J9978_02655 [Chromobacterium violaceum]|uniref:hypothetical protein n=1 Tax=Chromobacterium violaceum TaxID=536 RepID=UPI001B33DAE3|nr:hypothetical protein [Chromobacterium violaceum]MBP4048399.1 hypothetical protein [Chromobacterium violaceum]